MSTSAERTAKVPQENRLIFIERGTTTKYRTVRIPQQIRIVFIERQSTAAERTVFATED